MRRRLNNWFADDLADVVELLRRSKQAMIDLSVGLYGAPKPLRKIQIKAAAERERALYDEAIEIAHCWHCDEFVGATLRDGAFLEGKGYCDDCWEEIREFRRLQEVERRIRDRELEKLREACVLNNPISNDSVQFFTALAMASAPIENPQSEIANPR